MLTYIDSPEGINSEQLEGGFFAGWPSPPSPTAHLNILLHSDAIVLALDDSQTVVGFITAITDGVSCAYIPHLEVLAAYQGQGIGSELVRQMLAKLQNLYMIDLMCDPEVQPFYARLGMRPSTGMLIRNFDRQSCSGAP